MQELTDLAAIPSPSTYASTLTYTRMLVTSFTCIDAVTFVFTEFPKSRGTLLTHPRNVLWIRNRNVCNKEKKAILIITISRLVILSNWRFWDLKKSRNYWSFCQIEWFWDLKKSRNATATYRQITTIRSSLSSLLLLLELGWAWFQGKSRQRCNTFSCRHQSPGKGRDPRWSGLVWGS